MDYEDSFSRLYTAEDYQLVSIQNISGSVTVRQTDDAFITVSGLKSSYTREGLEAISILEGSPIDHHSGEKELHITTMFHSGDYGNMQVHYEIRVPENTRLIIKNDTGNVVLRGGLQLDSLRIITGNADIRDLVSARDIQVTTGKIRVMDTALTGNMKVQTGDIDAEIRSLSSNSQLSVSTGKLHVHLHRELNASIQTSIQTGSTNIQAVTSNGPYQLSLQCSTGEIVVRQLETD